jgi:hypothetical protein
MAFNALKFFLPDRPVPMRIWLGPFRGASLVMNPRHALRKVFGLYEHELNPWLSQALRRVTRVLDVGANDGYFTFGCAAAFRRQGKSGEIISFEPEEHLVNALRRSISGQAPSDLRIEVVRTLVGREVREGMTTLDALAIADRTNTLMKIDVEGAELDVIEGGWSWLVPSNLFVIEVHEERFLDQLRRLFAEHGHKLVQINQQPHRLLGREARGEQNWWLVSDLGAGH